MLLVTPKPQVSHFDPPMSGLCALTVVSTDFY